MGRHCHMALWFLLAASPLTAQTSPPGQQRPPMAEPAATTDAGTLVGLVDFGFRLNADDGDPALLQEFRDLRDGVTLNVFRYVRFRDAWQFDAEFENVGYRDQRYVSNFNRFGKLRASFEWTGVPWLHSTLTRTPYVKESDGVLRLPDPLQAAVQSRQANLADVARTGVQLDTRVRRNIADARSSYSVNPSTDVRVSFTSTNRTGDQPWGTGFGFGTNDELPLPIEQRTNDLNISMQWADRGRVLQVGYFGSFYDNDVPVLVWDSPLALSDVAGNPGQGRMAIFPSSTAHTVSALGTMPLPRRTRAQAYLSVGSWSQDEPILPYTINTAIPSPPLDRPTAEAEARIVALNLGVTTRALRNLMVSGRFRIYDFDNQTPEFAQPSYVRADQSVVSSALGHSEPFEYRRDFLDLSAVYTGLRFAALRAGYSMERDDRAYRFLEKTTDHVVRASADTTAFPWMMVRAQYEHSDRTGEGLDEVALSSVNEQVSLRQFDISDRVRDRLSAVVQLTPADTVGVTATFGVGRDDRPDDFFGLLDNDHTFFTVAVDLTPAESIAAGLSYGRENYDTRQRSRQTTAATFNDPTRDWYAEGDETADTLTANVDLPRVAPRTGLRFTYDYDRGRSRYVYLLAANSPLTAPDQLPPVKHELHHLQSDLRYDLTNRVAVGLSYWFDRFDVHDFAREPATLEPLGFATSGLFLGYMLTPSTLHTARLSLQYRW